MRSNFKGAVLAVAVAAVFAGHAAADTNSSVSGLPSVAQKSSAPKLPSVAQQAAEVVDPSEYGLEVQSGSKARTEVASVERVDQGGSEDPAILGITGGGASDDLPTVPSSVASSAPAKEVAPVASLQEVPVVPGVNTIIPAAVGHLNRIVTPFEKPIVQTVSGAKIMVKENVIYVSTKDESPVTMYITPKEDESVAISLTLAPRRVPPIQAQLVLVDSMAGGALNAPTSGGRSGHFRYSGQARKWEQGQPYMETIKGIMRSMALGQIPKGYSIGKASGYDTIPACYQEGIHFDFRAGQLLMGHSFQVSVGVARNTSKQPVMFDETACTHPSLAAAAAWPRNMLDPGEATEIYIVTRVGEAPAEESSRPSLLQ